MNIYSIQNSLIFIEARKFNDMDYVKIAILFVALILASLPGNAQNNQYKIDDSCYPLYRQADSLIATETVDSLIDLLYVQAQKVHDEKSLTLGTVPNTLENCILLISRGTMPQGILKNRLRHTTKLMTL